MDRHDSPRTLLADCRALEHLVTGGEPKRRRVFAWSLLVIFACDFLALYSQLEALENQRIGASYAREALIYILAMVFYLSYTRRLYGEASRDVAGRVGAWCRDLIARVLRLPLVRFEAIGRPALLARLGGDVNRIVNAAHPLVDAVRFLMLLVLDTAYTAALSTGVALVAVVVAAVICLVLVNQRRILAETNAEVARGEVRMHALFDGLVRGAGPIRQHAGRSRAIGAALSGLADDLRRLRTRVYDQFYARQYGVMALVYGVLGVNVFVLPLLLPIEAETIRRVDFVVVWLFFQIISLSFLLPELSRVADALKRLEEFDHEIDESVLEPPGAAVAASCASFTALGASGLVFRYPSTDRRSGYLVGPIDVTFRPGEVVFITGLNGSGKSTFLKMLTGLYVCEAGELQLDGRPVGAGELERWRALFSTIFTDYHLFAHAHGVAPTELADRGARLLAEMQLSERTGFDGDRIVDRALSTGEKKRLALVLARLSDRPVVVLDEWAAGQDPKFRAMFYRELLPALRAAGKLVLAVTHDDQYFHVADRALQFRDGRLVERVGGGQGR